MRDITLLESVVSAMDPLVIGLGLFAMLAGGGLLYAGRHYLDRLGLDEAGEGMVRLTIAIAGAMMITVGLFLALIGVAS